MAKKKITVQGIEVRIQEQEKEDFICLTDVAKNFSSVPSDIIKAWMRNRNTVEYLGTWEQYHNENFNLVEFDQIKSRTGLGSFVLTAKEWVTKTGAKGMNSTAGRYGGTFAHRDIAFEFCSYVSPVFKFYFIKEFQRLKEEEAKRLGTPWSVRREIAKANFAIHNEAVKAYLVPPKAYKQSGGIFANEADLLNVVVFGCTAKEWRLHNPEVKGNMRDHASVEELLVLSNLEVLNAKLIEWDSDIDQRFELLSKTAKDQFKILKKNTAIKRMKAEQKTQKKLKK